MYIAGSLVDGICLLRFDGYHSDAIANRYPRSKRHAFSDADLRANVAANNRAVANPNERSSNYCIAPYLDTCFRERNPDSYRRRSLRRHAEPR